jgi:hypothetical protein
VVINNETFSPVRAPILLSNLTFTERFKLHGELLFVVTLKRALETSGLAKP